MNPSARTKVGEPALEVRGLRLESICEAEVVAHPGEPGDPALGIEDIALDFGKGDRSLGMGSVPPSDGIDGVLPALVEQSGGGATLVFDKPIAIAVAVLVDPAQGCEHVGPKPLDQRVVTGPVVGLSEQDQPEWRRIHRPEVGREGQLTRARHLAAAELVEDLAGFRVAPRVHRDGLPRGELLECVDGQPWVERDGLKRRDDRVAAEHAGEPGNPRRKERSAVVIGRFEQAQVVHRPLDHLVDHFVVRLDDDAVTEPLRVDTRRVGGVRVRWVDLRTRRGVVGGTDVPLGHPAFAGAELRCPRRDDRAPAASGVAPRVGAGSNETVVVTVTPSSPTYPNTRPPPGVTSTGSDPPRPTRAYPRTSKMSAASMSSSSWTSRSKVTGPWFWISSRSR